jgi:hypothetical protein
MPSEGNTLKVCSYCSPSAIACVIQLCSTSRGLPGPSPDRLPLFRRVLPQQHVTCESPGALLAFIPFAPPSLSQLYLKDPHCLMSKDPTESPPQPYLYISIYLFCLHTSNPLHTWLQEEAFQGVVCTMLLSCLNFSTHSFSHCASPVSQRLFWALGTQGGNNTDRSCPHSRYTLLGNTGSRQR